MRGYLSACEMRNRKTAGLSRLGVFLLVSGLTVLAVFMFAGMFLAGRMMDEFLDDQFGSFNQEVGLTVFTGARSMGITNVNLDGEGPDYVDPEYPPTAEFYSVKPGRYTMTYFYGEERQEVQIEIVEAGGYIVATYGLAFGDVTGRAVVVDGKGSLYTERAESDAAFEADHTR